MTRHDVVVAGGGLAGSLVAWRLRQTQPGLDVAVVEPGATLGGNHTWCFHTSDLTPAQREWVGPLVAHSWPSYEVRFPALSRRIAGGYHAVPSSRLHEIVAPAVGPGVRSRSRAAALEPTQVTLDDGGVLAAACVIDARGWPAPGRSGAGYQTFLGQEALLAEEHGLEGPILMDATVPQAGGFRFVYVLPFGPRRLLIEDTCYADAPAIDREAARAAIGGYARTRGWSVESVLREEEGALPIPLSGGPARAGDVAVVGVRAGLFHPTTGYSLAEAVRTADAIAALPRLTTRAVAERVTLLAREAWRRGGFFRFLNRMLFHAAEPGGRYRVLERFHRLPEALIHRFYAGHLTAWDRVRLLTGRPPVPLFRAAACLFPKPLPRSA